jgi:VWFA-related protein
MPRRVALVMCLLCAALPLRSQTPPPDSVPTDQPVFRAGTTLVEVSAIVSQGGTPVTDLMLDEVEVLDEGRPQPLVAFEFVDLTVVEGPAQRRDFVLVLDDLHLSPRLTKPAQDVALAFIQALGPHDRLAIVNTGVTELVQQLSTNRAESRVLVKRLRGQQVRATTPLAPGSSGGMAQLEAAIYSRITFDVLRSVSNALQEGGAHERRTVVLISEGHRIFPEGAIGEQYPEVRSAYMDMLGEAATANMAVYAIDPRGLIAPFSEMGNSVGSGPAGGGIADRRFGSLGRLASYTGGMLTVDTNHLGKHIPQILQDSRQYYRLVYVQPDPEPGKRHPSARRIQVKVSRPGVQVRARQQYVPR